MKARTDFTEGNEGNEELNDDQALFVNFVAFCSKSDPPYSPCFCGSVVHRAHVFCRVANCVS
jgi:hypothetical protein